MAIAFAAAKPPPLSPALRLLWDRVNRFVQQEGGWLTSLPATNPIRLECQIDSPLPDLLRAANHEIRFIGSHERLMASVVTEHRGNKTFTNQVVAPGICHVWEINLTDKPKPDSDSRRRQWTAERLRQIEAQRKAPKPPPQEVIPEQPPPQEPIPEQQPNNKPTKRRRWRHIPVELKQQALAELRKGVRIFEVAKLTGLGRVTVGNLSRELDAAEKAEA
jgi:hypothetical protein